MMPADRGYAYLSSWPQDGGPCLRIEFSNRYYQIRQLNERELLSIVTLRNSGTISDINVLSPA